MKYEELDKIFNDNPWIPICLALAVVSVSLFILFNNYKYKTNIDKVNVKQVAFVANNNMNVHNNSLKPVVIKPLIKVLPKVKCDSCKTGYIPMCPRCNVLLNHMGSSHTVLQCPDCKQKTNVFCPVCNNEMHKTNKMIKNDKQLTNNNAISTYLCPVCGGNKFPNWDKNGRPVCPYCRNIMRNGF